MARQERDDRHGGPLAGYTEPVSTVPEDGVLEMLVEDEPDDGNPLLGRLCAAILAVISVLAVYQSYGLGLGSLANPGPGLWPFAVACVTAALTIVLTVTGATWARSPEGGNRWVIASIAAFIVYCAILPLFGFVISTVPLAFFFTRVIGNAGWITSTATGLAAPIAAYYLFDILLGVPLMGPSLW